MSTKLREELTAIEAVELKELGIDEIIADLDSEQERFDNFMLDESDLELLDINLDIEKFNNYLD